MTRWRDLRACQDTAAVRGLNPRDIPKTVRVPFWIQSESERRLDGATGVHPAQRHQPSNDSLLSQTSAGILTSGDF